MISTYRHTAEGNFNFFKITLIGSLEQIEPTENEKLAQLKNYMTQQGILSTLIKSLKRVNTAVQLEMLETIAKILYNSPTCQIEFQKIEGYSLLLAIFDKVP